MPLQVISGATNDFLTVGPSSKASRATLYGPDGEPRAFVSNRDRGIALIGLQHSAATAAPAIVWSIRSLTATRTLYIRKFWLQLYYAGTVGAASELQYELVKGVGCTASSGTAVPPLMKRTSESNPDVEVKVLNQSHDENRISACVITPERMRVSPWLEFRHGHDPHRRHIRIAFLHAFRAANRALGDGAHE
ncbi:MAG: hypothetical protein QOF51_1213 [Chloroflexota bacterium]|jgi:hypothetical protein|nr:hypothetical protein [Chloroflexota bacterium]